MGLVFSVPPLLRLAAYSGANWNSPAKAGRTSDEDHRPQYSHEEGQRKPAPGPSGHGKNKNVDDQPAPGTATASGHVNG